LAQEWIRRICQQSLHWLHLSLIFLTVQIIAGDLALSRGFKSLEFEFRRNFYEAFPPRPVLAVVNDSFGAHFRDFA
jgi:hypothetical protein